MNLYEKLIEIRKIVPYLQKDAKGYQYNYVSGSTVLGTIKEKMDELKVLLVSSVTSYQTEGKIVKCSMLMTWINAEQPEETLAIPFACFGEQSDISKSFGSALTYSERYFFLKFFNIATDKDDPDTFQNKSNTNTSIGPKKPLKQANSSSNNTNMANLLKSTPLTSSKFKKDAEEAKEKFDNEFVFDAEKDVITPAQMKRIFAIAEGTVDPKSIKGVYKKYGYTSSKDIKQADYDKICIEIEELKQIVLENRKQKAKEQNND